MGTSVLVITMTGAGQPWYMPLTWPLGHVATAVTKKEDDKPLKNAAVPYLDITGNFTAMAAAARSWTLAYLCIYYLPQKFGMVYPAFGPAKEFTLDWIVHILARNLIATWSSVASGTGSSTSPLSSRSFTSTR